MRKKNLKKKLSLARETIRRLDADQLRNANGGVLGTRYGDWCSTAGMTHCEGDCVVNTEGFTCGQ